MPISACLLVCAGVMSTQKPLPAFGNLLLKNQQEFSDEMKAANAGFEKNTLALSEIIIRYDESIQNIKRNINNAQLAGNEKAAKEWSIILKLFESMQDRHTKAFIDLLSHDIAQCERDISYMIRNGQEKNALRREETLRKMKNILSKMMEIDNKLRMEAKMPLIAPLPHLKKLE
jgi:hypothetical protein